MALLFVLTMSISSMGKGRGYAFVVGRVENGEFGIAIAYSAVLIVTMITAIMLLHLPIKRRKLRATDRVET